MGGSGLGVVVGAPVVVGTDEGVVGVGVGASVVGVWVLVEVDAAVVDVVGASVEGVVGGSVTGVVVGSVDGVVEVSGVGATVVVFFFSMSSPVRAKRVSVQMEIKLVISLSSLDP